MSTLSITSSNGTNQGSKIEASETRSRFTQFTQNAASFIHNPANIHNRSGAQELFVCLSVIIATVIAIATPIFGWAVLYYTMKEYNQQVTSFQENHVSLQRNFNTDIDKLKEKLSLANDRIVQSNQDFLKARSEIAVKDRGFRKAIREQIENKDNRKTLRSDIKKILRNDEYKIRTCQVFTSIVVT